MLQDKHLHKRLARQGQCFNCLSGLSCQRTYFLKGAKMMFLGVSQ